MQRAIDRPQAERPWRLRGLGRRSIAVLVAAGLLVGAGAPLGLYDGLGAGWDYGFSVQLARSTAVGATAIDDGFRVTIDRAYLDGERLMLAVRVVDERKRPHISQLMAMYSVVSDEDGIWAGAGVATSRPMGAWAATQIQWRIPPGPIPEGRHHLRVEVPHIFWRDSSAPPSEADDWNPWHQQDGAWSFDIDLPVEGGATVAHPDAPIKIDDVTFTVEEVVVGPTAIRVRLRYDDDATWTVVGGMDRGGQHFPFVISKSSEPGVIVLQTDGGSDQPAGAWSIVIDAADRQEDEWPEHRLYGPWKVGIHVP
jgi:hypothetical protein